MFSEGEAQQLIEILTEKAGIIQDTWHTVGLCHGSAEPQGVQGEGRRPIFRQAGLEGVFESGAEFSPGVEGRMSHVWGGGDGSEGGGPH